MLYTHNHIRNGDLGQWDTNTPASMDAQSTNTTLLRLQTNFDELDGRRRAWSELAGRTEGDKFVYSGHSSLRATLTSSASASDYRLGPEDMSLTAFTGATPEHIKTNYAAPGEERAGLGSLDRFRFTFAARSDQSDATVELRIILRNNADGVELYLQDGLGTPIWAAADTVRRSFLLQPRWQVYGATFTPPLGNANDVIEHFVWELSNGVAGAQVIDLDAITVTRLNETGGG